MSARLIVPMLEAIAATVEMQPWGVAAIHSADAVLLWDSRDDASLMIAETIASQRGTVIDTYSMQTQAGKEVIAVLVAQSPENDFTLQGLAGGLRFSYLLATSGEPDTTEDPF